MYRAKIIEVNDLMIEDITGEGDTPTAAIVMAIKKMPDWLRKEWSNKVSSIVFETKEIGTHTNYMEGENVGT